MPEQPDRDPTTGQLRPGGASLNPAGRPPKRTEAALLRAVRSAIDDKEILALFRALMEQAKGGDVAAATLVLKYLCGLPPQAPVMEPDTDDEPDDKPRTPQELSDDLHARFDAHEARGIRIDPAARLAADLILNRPRRGDLTPNGAT